MKISSKVSFILEAFKREIVFSIQIKNTLKTYKSSQDGTMLAVDFNVKKSVKGTPSTGEVTITGLLKEDIAWIATNFNLQSGQLNPSFFILSVGYGENLSEILRGNIVTAIPSLDNPNFSIKLNIQAGYLQNLENNAVAHSLKKATIKKIAENIAKNNKLSLDFKAKDKEVGDYAFAGSPLLQITRFREAYPAFDMFMRGDALVVTDKDFKGINTIKLSNKTGLIGTPKPTPTGCEIVCMLNPFLNIGDALELESFKLPQLNGSYFVFELTHTGANRGDAWISKINARNKGL